METPIWSTKITKISVEQIIFKPDQGVNTFLKEYNGIEKEMYNNLIVFYMFLAKGILRGVYTVV